MQNQEDKKREPEITNNDHVDNCPDDPDENEMYINRLAIQRKILKRLIDPDHEETGQ